MCVGHARNYCRSVQIQDACCRVGEGHCFECRANEHNARPSDGERLHPRMGNVDRVDPGVGHDEVGFWRRLLGARDSSEKESHRDDCVRLSNHHHISGAGSAGALSGSTWGSRWKRLVPVERVVLLEDCQSPINWKSVLGVASVGDGSCTEERVHDRFFRRFDRRFE